MASRSSPSARPTTVSTRARRRSATSVSSGFSSSLSIIFSAAVIVNVVALLMKAQAVWIGLLALFPLILLMITGLYLFVLPYVLKRRGGAVREQTAP